MELRNILKLTMGFVAGGFMLATSVQAAPLPPVSAEKAPITTGVKIEPAVVSQDAVDQMKPQQVRWHRGWHHHHWHHRHGGWHHHHWHHRHWGWHHHHRWHHRHWGWHHHHWHHHHWRHHHHW